MSDRASIYSEDRSNAPDRELFPVVRLLHDVVVELFDGCPHMDLGDLASADLGIVRDRPAPPQVLEHRRERTAATVSVPVSEKTGVGRLQRLVPAPGVQDIVDGSLRGVLCGRDVSPGEIRSEKTGDGMLTVFCGHMWTTICVWSCPCQRNVVCGKSLNWDQLNLSHRRIQTSQPRHSSRMVGTTHFCVKK